jgi:hypothetical protein
MIESYVNAIYKSDMDVISSYYDTFGEWECKYMPFGPVKSILPFKNIFGDACSIYRTKSIKSINGFPLDKGIIVDWAMWNKMAYLDMKMDTLPISLLNYRVLPNSHSRKISDYHMINYNSKLINLNDIYLLFIQYYNIIKKLRWVVDKFKLYKLINKLRLY